ncbi:hypothetical protein QR680_016484 [Steinernema hermaphroditum]|uniref:Uncharacterized protein n=1 Tax=Steinernema hermaphroditum TaxID=289476 RepID=A0AA39HDI2_9BILA|nr:hypothetical protein QR680_016484 [Steinernema hermaphroditum]
MEDCRLKAGLRDNLEQLRTRTPGQPLVLQKLFLRDRITREDIVAAVLEISSKRTLIESCDQRYKSPFYSCLVGTWFFCNIVHVASCS